MRRFEGIVSEIPVAKQVPVVVEKKTYTEPLVYTSNAIYIPRKSDAVIKAEQKAARKEKRRTFIIGLCASTVLMAFLFFGLLKAIGGTDNLEDNINYIQVSVESGDTLWDLIKESNPEYRGDIRELVYIAKNKNGTVELMAGDVIAIPVVNNED